MLKDPTGKTPFSQVQRVPRGGPGARAPMNRLRARRVRPRSKPACAGPQLCRRKSAPPQLRPAASPPPCLLPLSPPSPRRRARHRCRRRHACRRWPRRRRAAARAIAAEDHTTERCLRQPPNKLKFDAPPACPRPVPRGTMLNASSRGVPGKSSLSHAARPVRQHCTVGYGGDAQQSGPSNLSLLGGGWHFDRAAECDLMAQPLAQHCAPPG